MRASDVPSAWIRVRARKRTAEVPAAIDRVAGEVAPTVELDDAADDFVPTTEFRPEAHSTRWPAEPMTRAASTSTAWMKKTANYGTAFPGTQSAPTPQVLSAVSRVASPHVKERNPLEDLDLDLDELDFELDYSLELDPDPEKELRAIDDWSLAGLAPSTGAIDGPHSAAACENEPIELLEEIELVPLDSGDADPLEDPPTIDLDLRNDLSRRLEKPARSAEELRNDLLRRLDLAPQQTWREADAKPLSHAERIEALERAFDESEPLWASDSQPLAVAPAAPRAEPAASAPPRPRPVVAQWFGRAAGTALFFGVGIAASSGADLEQVGILAATATLCAAVAIPRRARVWTVFAIGIIAGVFGAWLNQLDVLRGVLAPQDLGIWQVASLGAIALMVAWLLTSVFEASTD